MPTETTIGGVELTLNTVLLISAKFPLIKSVRRALSAELTATLKVATCTNRKRLWMVTYTPTTII